MAKDPTCPVEQGGMEPFVTAQQYTPMSGMGLEFFPMNPDASASAWIACVESLVTTGMGEREQATQASPTL